MCGIGEPRDMRGFSGSCSIHQLIGCPLDAQPKDIRTYRNSDRRCEHVHKPRWRKTGDVGQGLERKIRPAIKVFAKVLENAPDSRVNLYYSAATQKIFAHPPFHALLAKLRTQR